MERPVEVDQRREAWRDFICSPEHAGRFLSSIGSAVQAALSDPIHHDELNAFLNSLGGGSDDAIYLGLVVHLMAGGYPEFVERGLPDLLDQLSSETRRRDEIVGPALRGNTRWVQTRIGRRTGQLPYGRYLSVTAHRSYDIAENRIVRRLIDTLETVLIDVSRRARPGRPPAILERMQAAVQLLRNHDAMRGLSAQTKTDRLDMRIAERSDRAPYRKAAGMLRALERMTDADPDMRWHAILMLLAVGWLEPVSNDDMFELYMLVLVLDVFATDAGFGAPLEYGLVRPDRRHVARFGAVDGDILVFFDISLARILGRSGRYSRTISGYGNITGSERRPDIVIVKRSLDGQADKVLLVEAKRSEDGRYLSDSVYKVFGYLYDFAEAIASHSPDVSAILAVPEDVSRLPGWTPSEVAIVSGDDRDELSRILTSFVEAPHPQVVDEVAA